MSESENVKSWNQKLSELHKNRFHRVPKDWNKECLLVHELEEIYHQLTEDERKIISYPQEPVRKPDLIAHDRGGHLIGFEECHCPIESQGNIQLPASSF